MLSTHRARRFSIAAVVPALEAGQRIKSRSHPCGGRAKMTLRLAPHVDAHVLIACERAGGLEAREGCC